MVNRLVGPGSRWFNRCLVSNEPSNTRCRESCWQRKRCVRVLWAGAFALSIVTLVWNVGFAWQVDSWKKAVTCRQLANSTLHIGEWRVDELRDVPLTIMNDGDQRLIVHVLNRDCCGESIAKTLVLAPAAIENFTVSLERPSVPGPFEQVVRFRTSDPRLPRFEMSIRGWCRQGESHAVWAGRRQALSSPASSPRGSLADGDGILVLAAR